MGQAVDRDRWRNRDYPHQMMGLHYKILEPGSRTLELSGTAGIVTLNWGRGMAYQVRFEGVTKRCATVYPVAGRFDLVLKGDVQLMTEFNTLGDGTLYGSITGLSSLTALQKLDLSNSMVDGDVSSLPASLQEIRLAGTGIACEVDFVPEWPDGVVIVLSDTSLPDADVNRFIRNLAGSAIDNGNLNIGGSNGNVTPENLVFVAQLESRGWVVNHN
ncbi:hypothetical protein G9409_08240 [Chlorobium sp. BLA1]|uniref:hypothetical protein n=1 Tax=Candidatus Chlorobium masyuteum TaxID=2716876 RepID=UPI00142308E0|nr:hypothetical protein [Candidatus Chlorobium masyuteum]NHQ60575.1 hypothetical protein [Candidatus Chlorobium masyuteum]